MMTGKNSRILLSFFLLSAMVFSLLALQDRGRPQKPAGPPAAGTGNKIGGPFSLTDQDGKTVTDRDFTKNRIVYFGFTSCPEICPLELRKITKAVELLGKDAEKLQVIFITTDPERDTPAVMKRYLATFGPVAITGLTGTPAQIKAVEKDYAIYARKTESETMNDYMMEHTSIIYLIAPDGTLLDMFGKDTSAGALADAIKAKT